MHVPDGLLDAPTAVLTAGLSLCGLGLALRHARRTTAARRAPLMGLAAAFLFSAQMLNFPVLGGVSGHLSGAVLTAVLLGPSAAVIVVSSVLIVQCLAFADGGLLALGANVFNMALLGAGGGWLVYRAVAGLFPGPRGQLLAAGFAAWVAVVAAAGACAVELSLSGVASWQLLLPALTGVHMIIGVGEALITTLILYGIGKARPDLLVEPGAGAGAVMPAAGQASGAVWSWELAGLALLMLTGLAMLITPLACQWPDGLEGVLEHLGVQPAPVSRAAVPLADYQAPGFSSPLVATAVAAGLGAVVVFCLSALLAHSLLRRPASGPSGPSEQP